MSMYFHRLEQPTSTKKLLAEFRNPEILSREGKGFPQGCQSLQGFSPQLSWSHYRALMRIDNSESRDFYLKEKRADYAEKKVSPLGTQLEREFGRVFGEKNLRRRIQFAEKFQTAKIVVTLSRQLERELVWDFDIPTNALTQAVKRNPDRCLSDIIIELAQAEKDEVVTNCDRLVSTKFFRSSVQQYKIV